MFGEVKREFIHDSAINFFFIKDTESKKYPSLVWDEKGTIKRSLKFMKVSCQPVS
jgi:hypothetical protein